MIKPGQLIKELKNNSDIFDPFMIENDPMTSEELVKLALVTINDMGYQVVPDSAVRVETYKLGECSQCGVKQRVTFTPKNESYDQMVMGAMMRR